MLIKALLFEFKRILCNKKNIFYFLLIVLLFSLFCFLYKNIISLTNYTIDYDQLRESNIIMRDDYKFQYEIAYGLIDRPENIVLPPNIFSMKEELKYQFLKYDYFVNTNTSVFNYINLNNPLSSGTGLERGVFIYQMATVLPIFLFLISIFISNFYIFKDADSKNKLFVQGNVSLKSIYFAKLILALMFVLFISFIYCIVVLLCVGKENYYILVINDVANKMNIKNFLFIKLIISLSNSLLLVSVCSTLYYFVKKPLYNSLISFSILAINYIVYFFSINFVGNDRKAEIIKVYFPFVNSHLFDYTLSDKRLWGIIIFNTIIMVLMIFIYNRNLKIKYN